MTHSESGGLSATHGSVAVVTNPICYLPSMYFFIDGRVAMKRVPLPEQGAGQPNFDPLGPLATQPIVSRARKRPAEPLIAIPRPRRKSKYQKPLGSKFKMRSRRIQSKRTQSKQIQPKQIQFQIGSNPTRRERFVTQDQPRNLFVTKCRKKVICARKL